MDEKGAKWTRKYSPVDPIPWERTPPGKTKATPKNKPNSDEDKLTLKLMKKHGIQNVRGGSWCMVKMRKRTFREIEGLIGKPKASAKKGNKTYRCGRCGRQGHNRTNCRLKTTIDGVRITTKNWEYRPPEKKSKKGTKNVICARCNRVGHESKDCYSKTKVAGTGVFADLERRGLPKR
jgi:hypothetical protein